MHFKTLVVAAIAVLGDTAFGAAVAAANKNPLNNRCVTTLGNAAVQSVPTATRVRVTPCTTTKTSKVTVTETAPRSTVTVTVQTITTKTASKSTRTATKTTVKTVRATYTNAIISKTTVTLSQVSTELLPAPTGFLPVQDTLPDSEYRGSGGPAPAGKRDVDEELSERADTSGQLLFKNSKPRHPKAVACFQVRAATSCSTTVTTATQTKTVVPTKTRTTTTSTSTTITYPGATTTKVVTRTTTLVSTTDKTVRRTKYETSYTATTTVYQVCATPNIADTVVSQPIANLYQTTGKNATGVQLSASSAYDCCVAAYLTTVNSGGVIWAFAPALNNTCIYGVVPNSTTCANQRDITWAAQYGNLPFGVVSLGNLPCGVIDSSGPNTDPES